MVPSNLAIDGVRSFPDRRHELAWGTQRFSQLIDIAGICKLDIRLNQRHSFPLAANAKSGPLGVMAHGVAGAQENLEQ